MILESFSKYLQSADPELPAVTVLVRWLWERLTLPAQNNVDRVIQHEISIERKDERTRARPKKRSSEPTPSNNEDDELSLDTPRYSFVPTSSSGSRLLKSLYEYAMSFEQQRWSRWVHRVKASDFKPAFRKDLQD